MRHSHPVVLAGGFALMAVLTACGGTPAEPDPTSPAAVDGPAVPSPAPGEDSGPTPSPSPSPTVDTVAAGDVWNIPTEGGGWVTWESDLDDAEDQPGVFSFEQPRTGCHATLVETPLDELDTDASDARDTVNATIASLDDIFDWVEPHDSDPLSFTTPDGATTYEFVTRAALYPSYTGEDRVYVTSAYWTDTHQLTAGVVCPGAQWQAGAEETAIAFIQQATFQP